MKEWSAWDDAGRNLTIRLATGSRMLPGRPQRFEVRAIGSDRVRPVNFTGEMITVRV
jgi:hypothetical protein